MSKECQADTQNFTDVDDVRKSPAAVTSPDEGTCDLMRYIDESGSSSCASSLIGDASERHLMDDTTSLSNLLDDVGSGQFSIDALDDLASMSCGYGSLDTRSEAGSDIKLLSSVIRRNKKIAKSDVFLDREMNGTKSLEKQRKLLKPCGEMLMRRSLGSEEVLNVPSINRNIPSVSLPGSTQISSKVKLGNHFGDDISSKCSSHRSYHTSQSSIKSSDNIIDDFELPKGGCVPFTEYNGRFHCSSPMVPPQCTPPPVPQGESSYVTSTSSSSSLESAKSLKGKCDHNPKRRSSNCADCNQTLNCLDLAKSDNLCVSNPVQTILCDSVANNNTALVDRKTEKENAINDTHKLMVPLADMDEFSETKDDHTYDTLESKSDKDDHDIFIRKNSDCENDNIQNINDDNPSAIKCEKSSIPVINTIDNDIKDDAISSPEVCFGSVEQDNSVVGVGDEITVEIKSKESQEPISKANISEVEGDYHRAATALEKVPILFRGTDDTAVAVAAIEQPTKEVYPQEPHTPHRLSGVLEEDEDDEARSSSCTTPLTPNSKIHFPQVRFLIR